MYNNKIETRFKSIVILLTTFLTILLAFNLFSINFSAATLTENDGLKYIEQENGDMKLYTGWTKNKVRQAFLL